ncbi:MAG: carboxylating nicotinate-nucleotide diphosphorylase [Cyclobacteriaceae bacterium]
MSLKIKYLTKEAVLRFVDRALKEDIGDGDHSSLSSIPQDLEQKAKLISKDEGVLAGVQLAEWIFARYDKTVAIDVKIKDGEEISTGDTVLLLEGKARSILSAERLILNCIQRMSGIATYTKKMTELIRGTGVQILDTRKTTPNFRICEKWAVKIGGAENHRFGLYDMIMLKDNHIDYAGGIEKAVTSTKKYLKDNKKDLKIEVETRTLSEVTEAIESGGVDVIMLDNMLPSMMKEALQIIDGRCKTEASGGITEKNIREIAQTGVDYISVGALTHSYRSLDLSLKAIKEK